MGKTILRDNMQMELKADKVVQKKRLVHLKTQQQKIKQNENFNKMFKKRA